MTWMEWAQYEERKRLTTFALILDGQLAMAFGGNFHLRYTQLAIRLPCSDTIWRCNSEEQWLKTLPTHPPQEEAPATALLHCLENTTMHPSISHIFSALALLAGAFAVVPTAAFQLPNKHENPINKRLRETRAVVVWSWYEAYKMSFVPGEQECEIFYHGGMIHHSNITSQLLRLAAGEPRIGGAQVKLWQKDHATEKLREIFRISGGRFAAWHAVQMYQVRLLRGIVC